jgi:hypothetical protein
MRFAAQCGAFHQLPFGCFLGVHVPQVLIMSTLFVAFQFAAYISLSSLSEFEILCPSTSIPASCSRMTPPPAATLKSLAPPPSSWHHSSSASLFVRFTPQFRVEAGVISNLTASAGDAGARHVPHHTTLHETIQPPFRRMSHP